MLSLSTLDFQPLPLFLRPLLLPPHTPPHPPGPTSTTSSWFGAGGRESREAGAGRRHRTAGSRGQSLERGLGAHRVASRFILLWLISLKCPAKSI